MRRRATAILLLAITVLPAGIQARTPADIASPELVVDGKVLIKRIQLKGETLFPQYGVTEAFLNARLKAAYANMDPWMSVADMHRLADTLAQAYQEQGLTFNQVFVVPDAIDNHTLTINVLPGRISEINIRAPLKIAPIKVKYHHRIK